MHKELTDKEKKKFVDKHIAEIFPQLQINMEKVCGMGSSKWADDLLQLSMEMFLEKDLEVQYDACLNNTAENFVTFIANFQLKRGKTTRFYHTHRKFIGQTRELFVGSYNYDNHSDFSEPFDEEESNVMRCVNKQIADLDPFDRMLVQERLFKGTQFKDLAERFNINYNVLSVGLNKILKKIKAKCEHLR